MMPPEVAIAHAGAGNLSCRFLRSGRLGEFRYAKPRDELDKAQRARHHGLHVSFGRGSLA
jgi:hypothetical protein